MNTNNEMKLWECVYIVRQDFDTRSTFAAVTDWIWSTNRPDGNAIGHYWITLHNAIIYPGAVYQVPNNNYTAKYRVLHHIQINADGSLIDTSTGEVVWRKESSKESGQAILLFLMAVVCIAVVLYLCYTAISMLSGSEGGLFEVLIGGLEEVIK